MKASRAAISRRKPLCPAKQRLHSEGRESSCATAKIFRCGRGATHRKIARRASPECAGQTGDGYAARRAIVFVLAQCRRSEARMKSSSPSTSRQAASAPARGVNFALTPSRPDSRPRLKTRQGYGPYARNRLRTESNIGRHTNASHKKTSCAWPAECGNRIPAVPARRIARHARA